MSDPKRLLGGYATDSLTEAERHELLCAALDDQELFDSLVEDEGLRELLETPGARQRVLEALERPTRWERFRGWLTRPAIVADLVVVAGVVILAAVGLQLYRGFDESDISAPAARPASVVVTPSTLARLYELPAQEVSPVGLKPEGGAPSPWRVRPGEMLALRATLRVPAQMLVIGEGPDGSPVQVFPAGGRAPALVEEPASGGPAIRRFEVVASGTPGAHRLRLVAAPLDVPILAATPEQVEKLISHLSLVDLMYEVATPSRKGTPGPSGSSGASRPGRPTRTP